MSKLNDLIEELKDPGVSGDFADRPASRAELAEALEVIVELLKELSEDK